MNKILLLFSFLIVSLLSLSQNNLLVITSTMENDLSICNRNSIYRLTIENPSPFTIANDTLVIGLPTGIVYVPSSSVNVTEFNVVNNNSLVFVLPTINSLQTINVSIEVSASCAVKQFLLSGGILQNSYGVNYTAVNNGSSFNQSQSGNSLTYNSGIPSLSLISVTNQSYNANVGGSVQRCLTIVNGGNGRLSTFNIDEEHTASINISSISVGTATPISGGTNFNFSGADFSSIGNFDNFFDPGETFVFCETVELLSCISPSSVYKYYWGCGGEKCQLLSDFATVSFPGTIPNLVSSVNNSFAPNQLNDNCYGNNGSGDFESSITYVNNGAGTAFNVSVNLFQGAALIPTADYFSSLNLSSFTIRKNSGATQTINPSKLTNLKYGLAKSCLPASPISGLDILIDSIRPGDSITISWNHFTCCYNSECSPLQKNLLGWKFSTKYKNFCDRNFTLPLVQGSQSFFFMNSLAVNQTPGTLSGNSTGTFSFLNANFAVTNNAGALPANTANDRWIYEVVLPPCVTYVPSTLALADVNGNPLNSVADSMYSSGDTIKFIYNDPVGNLQSVFNFGVQLDCSSCNISGIRSVSIKTYYIPDLDCGCRINMGCLSTDIEISCPSNGCNGSALTSASVLRKNYGLVDNDNNGIPDASGAMNMSMVKRTRYMYGDTMTVMLTSALGNPSNLALNHFIEQTIITNTGGSFAYLNSDVRYYNAATSATYSFAGLIPNSNIASIGSGSYRFANEYSIAFLQANGLPTSITEFNTGDSLISRSYYQVTTNIGGAIVNGKVRNATYLADSPYDPLNTTNLVGCNSITRDFTLLGYYYFNAGTISYQNPGCNSLTIAQSFYMSIGPCCNNYNGGNLFPFEYRYWAAPDTLTVTMPADYALQSSRFNFVRTAGNLISNTTPWFPITPSLAGVNNYKYDMNPFFGSDIVNDPILFGDDGWSGTLEMTFLPNCNIQKDTVFFVDYSWDNNFNPDYSVPPGSNVITALKGDAITYRQPNLSLLSNLTSTNTPTGQVAWNLTMSNTSAYANASDFWLAAPTINTVIADSMLNTVTGVMYYPTANGIFPLPALGINSVRNYRLFTTLTTCLQGSIKVYYGWGCSGVPIDVSLHDCVMDSLTLSITPLFPQFETSIVNLGSDTTDLCEQSTYTIGVKDFQLGNGYNMFANVFLPSGMTIVPGSCSYQYLGAAVPVSDPVFISGTQYQWEINTITNDFNTTSGLSGILNSNLNSFDITFEVLTDCNYISGGRIRVQADGESFCGTNTESVPSYSNGLFITDALPQYETTIKLGIDFITPCAGGSNMLVTVINNGPEVFSNSDSLVISLWDGMSYNSTTFTGIHNTPTNSGIQTILNNTEIITWGLPSGILPGDSVVFSINLSSDPSVLDCEIIQLRASTITSGSSVCNSNTCDLYVTTSDTIKNVFVYKSYINISNSSATSVPSAPFGESVTVLMDIQNSGETIISGTPTIIKYYNDNDNNGVYSSGDQYIISDTIFDEIITASVYQYNETILFPGAYSCNVIAVIDTSSNNCICSGTSTSFSIDLSSPPLIYEVCSGELVIIGNAPINGHNYLWNSNVNLSSTNSAQPTFILNNVYPAIDTLNYVRQITNSTCSTTDTVTIIVFSSPTVNAGLDTSLCAISQVTLNGNAPQAVATGYWKYIGLTSGITFTDSTLYNTQANNLTEGIHPFVWNLSQGNCPVSSDTVLVTVFDTPIANAGLDLEICSVYDTVLGAQPAIGTSTGLWSQIAVAPAIIQDLSNPISGVNDLSEGQYDFIWTVSNGVCPVARDTVRFIIYDQPTSIASADLSYCDSTIVQISGNIPLGTALGNWYQSSTGSQSNVIIQDATSFQTTVSQLSEGTYNFVWLVANGNCPVSRDTIEVAIYNSIISLAGADVELCSESTYTALAEAPTGTASGLWSQANSNVGSTIESPALFNTVFSGLTEGVYNYIWTLSNGVCPSNSDTVKITIYDQPVAKAGLDMPICAVYDTLLLAETPFGTSIGSWSQISLNPALIQDITDPNSRVSGLQEGSYDFIWSVSNGICPIDIDTVRITVYDQPTSIANSDFSYCDSSSSLLIGNLPIGSQSGYWYQSSTGSQGAVVINDSSAFQTTVNQLTEGTYNFVWLVSNGNCPVARDTSEIIIYNSVVANAGVDIELCSQFTYVSLATAPIGTASGSWTQDVANNGSSIDSPNLYNTTFGGMSEGVYNYIWTLSNGICPTDSDTVKITIYNQSVNANAGNDTILCNETNYLLNASPSVGTATGSWSLDGSYGNASMVNFSDATLYNSYVSDLQNGNYSFVWTIENGVCLPDRDSVIVLIRENPEANLVFQAELCEGECTLFNAVLLNPDFSNLEFMSWDINGSVFNQNNFTSCFDNFGNYPISIQLISSDGCQSYLSGGDLIVHPNPVAEFSYTPENLTEIYNLANFENESTGAVSYIWNFGDGSPATTLKNPDHSFPMNANSYYEVQLVATTEFGCIDTISKEIKIGYDNAVYVPNTFTPDGSGYNSTFFAVVSDGVDRETFKMQIFDRWGEIIFNANNYNESIWDGTYKNRKVQDGTYTWVIYYSLSYDAKTIKLVGHVNVLK